MGLDRTFFLFPPTSCKIWNTQLVHIATSLVIYGGCMNILFIIKVKEKTSYQMIISPPPPPPIMLTIAFRMVKKLQTHRSIFFQHVYFIWAFLDPHPNIYPSNIGIRLFQLWFINTKRPTLEKRARAWGWMWLFNRACSTMSRRLTYMYLFNLHQPLFKVRWSPFTCLSQQGVVEGNLNRKEK